MYNQYPLYDAHGRMVPRFFPFVYQESTSTSQFPKVTRYTSNETIGDDDHTYHFHQSRAYLTGVREQVAGVNGSMISPKDSSNLSVITPSINSSSHLEVSCRESSSEDESEGSESAAESSPKKAISRSLNILKQIGGPNGVFDFSKTSIPIPFEQVVDEAIELAKDQTGSRYIQQLLDSHLLTSHDIHELFIRILPSTNELTMDPFGNYVMQKMIDDLPESNRHILLRELSGNFFNLSIHMYGCRVVQRLIETTNIEGQICIASELRGHVVECVEDQNANHVIQKLIERLPSHRLQPIVCEIIGHIPRMGIHCYGCRVVQRLIEKLMPPPIGRAGGSSSKGAIGNAAEDANRLIGEILAHLWQLSQDQYGNYVIQHVLTHGTVQHRSVIVQVIASHIVEFSCHKYASNIAEKALLCSLDQISRDLIIGAVIGSGGPDSPLNILMKDRFANYVIQRCLDFSHGQQRLVLIDILRANLPMLKGVIYGKHIANAIEKIISSSST